MSSNVQIIKKKLLVFILIVVMTFLFIPMKFSYGVTVLEPTDDQKVEYRAVSRAEVNGKKQLIIEVRLKHLNIKGMDLRLQYNDSLLTPSDMTTNQAIDVNDADDIPSNFSYINGFEKFMDMMEMEPSNGELRMIYSILGEDERTGTNDYFKDDNNDTRIEVPDEAVVARISFQMGDGEITTDDIKLKTGTNSPTTGIKVVTNNSDNYQNQSLFIFTLDLKSKNADLADLKLSNGSDEDGDYREYTLDPKFDKDTLEYTTEILEYVDKANLSFKKADKASTVQIKKPKVDDDGNITYEIVNVSDDSLDITDEITLMELGKGDTTIEIIITAEDTAISKTYKLVIKRPCGKLKGKVQLGNGLRESVQESYGVYVKYIADIKLFKPGDIVWDNILLDNSDPSKVTMDYIDGMTPEISAISDDEGEFTLYVIPGNYDLLFEKSGFLSNVIKTINISKDEEIDLGTQILDEGDADRSQIIDLNDMVDIMNANGYSSENPEYVEDCDFGKKGVVNLDDMVCVTQNMYKTINIKEYNN